MTLSKTGKTLCDLSRPLTKEKEKEKRGEMRGVGGPLLCIGDLLNDVGESNPETSQPELHLYLPPPSSTSISSHSIDLTKLFEENYKDLNEAFAGSDQSWTGLTLKDLNLYSLSSLTLQNGVSFLFLVTQLCSGLETANKLVQSTNSNVRSLSEKVGELEEVFKKGDTVVAAVRGVISSFSEIKE
ncbi:uncharacterized protein LOC133807412 isoform X1 [Humulus lupulus]|uniref:uncharacterized protein LOC133807412 isoform X1 n=1 Tax=Humulus lupulus TaxID=3486 RepID=UPI002B410354|nr:uncharacterized protein LOC133807412 isoform X1 [Humulus lupulus]